MNKFSKDQKELLESALDKLYAFLKGKFNVDYHSSIRCIVYNDIVHLYQCSCEDRVAWFADIVMKDRKIYLSTREVEREYVYSKLDYDLFYMSTTPIIHHIDF